MNLTVLIVDDELDVAEALAEGLESREMDVRIAISGEAALELIQTESVDVVVLDVKMRGMGGVETLEALRSRFPTIGVIMLSGHADISCAVTCMTLGAFDYLVKPVQLDELIFRIQDAYNVHRFAPPVRESQ